jgi:hypothetical protein
MSLVAANELQLISALTFPLRALVSCMHGYRVNDVEIQTDVPVIDLISTSTFKVKKGTFVSIKDITHRHDLTGALLHFESRSANWVKHWHTSLDLNVVDFI